jgi:hypothetical protein
LAILFWRHVDGLTSAGTRGLDTRERERCLTFMYASLLRLEFPPGFPLATLRQPRKVAGMCMEMYQLFSNIRLDAVTQRDSTSTAALGIKGWIDQSRHR